MTIGELLVLMTAVAPLVVPGAPGEVCERYRTLTEIVVRAITRRVGRRQLAEDIVQEFWVQFLRRDFSRQYNARSEDGKRAFLAVALRNLSNAAIRKHYRDATEMLERDIPESALDPADAVELDDTCEVLREELAKLPVHLAQSICARYGINGVRPDEQLTPATRYGRCFRARTALKPALSDRLGHLA